MEARLAEEKERQDREARLLEEKRLMEAQEQRKKMEAD